MFGCGGHTVCERLEKLESLSLSLSHSTKKQECVRPAELRSHQQLARSGRGSSSLILGKHSVLAWPRSAAARAARSIPAEPMLTNSAYFCIFSSN